MADRSTIGYDVVIASAGVDDSSNSSGESIVFLATELAKQRNDNVGHAIHMEHYGQKTDLIWFNACVLNHDLKSYLDMCS